MDGETTPPDPACLPQVPPAPKAPKADLDLDALFPLPERKGPGPVAEKWHLPPGPVNGLFLVLSLVGMIVLGPALLRFALAPAPEGEVVLFDYRLLLKMIVFLGCLGFFCAAAGFRFAHWVAGKITDLIFGIHDGPPPGTKE